MTFEAEAVVTGAGQRPQKKISVGGDFFPTVARRVSSNKCKRAEGSAIVPRRIAPKTDETRGLAT